LREILYEQNLECYDIIILDEAHTAKNIKSKLRIALDKLKGKFKCGLSGTPLQNNLMELWPTMNWVNNGSLGTREYFNKTFAKKIQSGFLSDSNPSAVGLARALAIKLKTLLAPFLLRREKTMLMKEVSSPLPPKLDIVCWLPLTDLQKTIYKKLINLRIVHDNSSKDAKFVMLHILKKLCDHPLKFLQY
jgi:SNF2 family DNA or RNA helicase